MLSSPRISLILTAALSDSSTRAGSPSSPVCAVGAGSAIGEDPAGESVDLEGSSVAPSDIVVSCGISEGFSIRGTGRRCQGGTRPTPGPPAKPGGGRKPRLRFDAAPGPPVPQAAQPAVLLLHALLDRQEPLEKGLRSRRTAGDIDVDR